MVRGAAIAQWIRLHLPSCRPGFESQAHHLCFFNLYLSFELECEKNENKQKEAGIGPFFKKKHGIEAGPFLFQRPRGRLQFESGQQKKILSIICAKIEQQNKVEVLSYSSCLGILF